MVERAKKRDAVGSRKRDASGQGVHGVMKAVGGAVRRAREARQLSQEQLAEELGLSTQAVSAIETGRTAPRFITLTALSSVLDVSIASLFAHIVVRRDDEEDRQIQELVRQLDDAGDRRLAVELLRTFVAGRRGPGS